MNDVAATGPDASAGRASRAARDSAAGPDAGAGRDFGERPLSRTERIQFQTDLTKLGFDPGAADGVLGRQSRAALRQYQKNHGLAVDGFPTAALLTVLDQAAAKAVQ